MTAWRLVCDAGGTNVRVGRSSGGTVAYVRVLPSAAGLDIAMLLANYVGEFEDRAELEGAAIAAAGPVQDEAVELTNADIVVRAAAVREALQRPVRLLNDLEAVAWALPHLPASDLQAIRDCDMPLEGSKLAINIGTGFGAALLVETRHGAHVCALEPGHMKLASAVACQPATVTARRSIEDVLSGTALADPSIRSEVWRYAPPVARPGADLFRAARDSCEGQRFIADFSALFGQVCGDLVLATGAWGGVYISGSVAGAWAHAADIETYISAFCDKGPMSGRMMRVPTYHIVARHPALLGLARAPLF